MSITCYKDLLEGEAKNENLSIPDYIDLLKNTRELYKKLLEDPSGMIERISLTTCDCNVLKTVRKTEHRNPVSHAEGCRYRRMFGI